MIGAFGFYRKCLPGRVMGYGVDSYRDIGFDAQYQYINDVHALTLKVSRISETQNLQATFAQGVAGQAINALGIVNAFGLPPLTGNASSNPTNSLTSFKASAAYVWDHTISGTVGYFSVRGTADGTLYGNALLGLSGPQPMARRTARADLRHRLYAFSKGSRASIRGPTPRSACPTRITFSSMAGRPNFDGLEPITTAAAGARTRRPTTTRCSLYLDRVLNIDRRLDRSRGAIALKRHAVERSHAAFHIVRIGLFDRLGRIEHIGPRNTSGRAHACRRAAAHPRRRAGIRQRHRSAGRSRASSARDASSPPMAAAPAST